MSHYDVFLHHIPNLNPDFFLFYGSLLLELYKFKCSLGAFVSRR